MIYGIGVDLVEIRRISNAIHKWQGRFIKRVFTAGEVDLSHHSLKFASSLALRFAAKEAFSKAIGLGMKKGIRWRDIEVVHNSNGRPELKLNGEALRTCESEGIRGWHVSLSDEGDYGVAVVVLETGESM
ncbi:MAG: holo-ACP synthase [Thermodesulfobacteriota bacterium]